MATKRKPNMGRAIVGKCNHAHRPIRPLQDLGKLAIVVRTELPWPAHRARPSWRGESRQTHDAERSAKSLEG